MENAKDGFARHFLQEQNFKDLKSFCFCFVLIFKLLAQVNILGHFKVY